MLSILTLLQRIKEGISTSATEYLTRSDFFFNGCVLINLFFNIYLLIWPCQVLVAARGIFVVACGIFSLWHSGLFSSCDAQAPECTGLVAPRHVRS